MNKKYLPNKVGYIVMLRQIQNLLKDKKIEFKEWHHEPVRTSEEAAKARGVDIKLGAKSLVLKADNRFIMCVLSAAKRIDSKRLKIILSAKNVRFASSDELFLLTACEPGGVPPLGNLFGLPTLIDKSLVENECIDFNAGSLSDSMMISTKDYLALVPDRIEDFSE